MGWRRLVLYGGLAIIVLVSVSVAFVTAAFLLSPGPVSNLEVYAVLGLVGGVVGTFLFFPLLRLFRMRVVVRDGRVVFVGGLAGQDNERDATNEKKKAAIATKRRKRLGREEAQKAQEGLETDDAAAEVDAGHRCNSAASESLAAKGRKRRTCIGWDLVLSQGSWERGE